MVKFKRQHIEVKSNRRNSDRIEFHYPVVILGIDEKAQILDFSPEGLYIEMHAKNKLAVGRHVNLALKLPTEKEVLRLRAKVAYTDKTGIGCQLVDTTVNIYQSLERCFNIINSTLPLE
ncbi:MAG: PilZ domain-containing protein [Desulfobacteraceae bacterium]|jgi:hypothetical protein